MPIFAARMAVYSGSILLIYCAVDLFDREHGFYAGLLTSVVGALLASLHKD